MRIEDGDTATSAMATYELLEPARYIASPPTWREFLMVDSFPEAEEPKIQPFAQEFPEEKSHLAQGRARGMERRHGAGRPALCGQCFPHGKGISRHNALPSSHGATSFLSKGRHRFSRTWTPFLPGNKLNIGQQVCYRDNKAIRICPQSRKNRQPTGAKGKERI